MSFIKNIFHIIFVLLLLNPAWAWSASEEGHKPVAPKTPSTMPEELGEILTKEIILTEIAIGNGLVEMVTSDGRRIEVDLNASAIELPQIPELDGIFINPELSHKIGEPDKGVQITTGKTKVIEEGESVDQDLVVFGSDIIVRGTVDGDVLAINGDVTVTSTGRVNGDVSSIGGTIEKESGAVIRGEMHEAPTYGLKGPDFSFPSLLLVLFALSLLFALVVASLAPKNVGKVRMMISKGTLKSLLLGYAYIFAIPIVIVILAITIIGIPVAILVLPLAICAAIILGFTSFSVIVGEKFLEMINAPDRSILLSVLLGATLCQAIFVIGGLIAMFGGLVGGLGTVFKIIGLVIFGLIILPISFGASITTLMGTRPKETPTIEIRQV